MVSTTAEQANAVFSSRRQRATALLSLVRISSDIATLGVGQYSKLSADGSKTKRIRRGVFGEHRESRQGFRPSVTRNIACGTPQKRLRNSSGIPNVTINNVVSWIAAELGIDQFDVEVRNCSGALAGSAFTKGARSYHGNADHSLSCGLTLRP
jgi:hypothetical protein